MERSTQAGVDITVSALANFSLLHPHAEAFYRSADGKYISGLAENISSTLVDGASPSGLKGRWWKGDRNMPIAVMAKTGKAYELVELLEGSKANRGGAGRG